MLFNLSNPKVDLVIPERKENAKGTPQYAAILRSFDGPISVTNADGDVETIEPEGNREPHADLRLNAAQYARWTEVQTALSSEDASVVAAMVETIRNDGGIRLPSGGGGRAVKHGATFDLAALLAEPEESKSK